MTWAIFGILLLPNLAPDDNKTSVKPIDGDAIRRVDFVGSAPRDNVSSITVTMGYPINETKNSSNYDPVQSSVKPIDDRDKSTGVLPVTKGIRSASKERTNKWLKRNADGSSVLYKIESIRVGISIGKKTDSKEVIDSARRWQTVPTLDSKELLFNNIQGKDVVRIVVELTLKNENLPEEIVPNEYIIETLEFGSPAKKVLTRERTERPNKKPLD
jgi:hypothetical protein